MPETTETPTLIVGAGPAGLAVAGRMRRLGLPFEIIDGADSVAARWRTHYDRLHLHTVKQLSHLPYRPFPDDYPRYVSRDALVRYYEEYAEAFLIRPRFGQMVAAVRHAGDRWHVQTEAGDVYMANNVVMATGANRIPNRPEIDGESRFAGRITHSSEYRNPEPFLGRSVLVVGMGNTGAEIALDLCEHGVEVAISVRGPVNIVPRDFLRRPTQLTARQLDRLPDRIADRIGLVLRRMTMGDLGRFGIASPKLAPVAQLRTRGKTPVIDVGTMARIKSGDIGVRPGVRCLDVRKVVFADGSEEAFDEVILATGYRPLIEQLVEDGSDLLDANGYPASVVGSGKHQGLFFTGFDNYQTGGVLGTLMEESEEIVEAIAGGKSR